MTLRRLQILVSELQASDGSGKLLGLIVGDLAGLEAPRAELRRMAVEPGVRTAVLSFLEGLQAARDAEREAEEESQFLAFAGERVQ